MATCPRTNATAAGSLQPPPTVGIVVVVVVVLAGGVHAPNVPICPALFVGAGQASAKSAASFFVLLVRARLKVPSPGGSGVGVPTCAGGVPVNPL